MSARSNDAELFVAVGAGQSYPWPRCARCDRPAQAMRQWVDQATREMVLGVECHGAFERVTVSHEMMLAAQHMELREWNAFVPRLIDPTVKP